MADDSLITALSGFSGVAAGIRDVLVPHMQAKYKDKLDMEKEKRAIDSQKAIKLYEQSIKPKPKIQVRNEETGELISEEEGEHGQTIEQFKVKPPKVKKGLADLNQQEATAAFKLADDLRQDSADFVKKRSSYNNVIASAKDAEKSVGGASDIALIYAFTKLQDPTMVTEQEIRNAIKSGSFGERVKAAYDQAVSGKKLTTEMRKDFVSTSKRIYDRALAQQRSTEKEIKKRGDRLGLPQDAYFTNYESVDDSEVMDESSSPGRINPKPAVSPGSPKPKAALIGQEVERSTKDGRIAIFDANTKKFLRYK